MAEVVSSETPTRDSKPFSEAVKKSVSNAPDVIAEQPQRRISRWCKIAVDEKFKHYIEDEYERQKHYDWKFSLQSIDSKGAALLQPWMSPLENNSTLPPPVDKRLQQKMLNSLVALEAVSKFTGTDWKDVDANPRDSAIEAVFYYGSEYNLPDHGSAYNVTDDMYMSYSDIFQSSLGRKWYWQKRNALFCIRWLLETHAFLTTLVLHDLPLGATSLCEASIGSTAPSDYKTRVRNFCISSGKGDNLTLLNFCHRDIETFGILFICNAVYFMNDPTRENLDNLRALKELETLHDFVLSSVVQNKIMKVNDKPLLYFPEYLSKCSQLRRFQVAFFCIEETVPFKHWPNLRELCVTQSLWHRNEMISSKAYFDELDLLEKVYFRYRHPVCMEFFNYWLRHVDILMHDTLRDDVISFHEQCYSLEFIKIVVKDTPEFLQRVRFPPNRCDNLKYIELEGCRVLDIRYVNGKQVETGFGVLLQYYPNLQTFIMRGDNSPYLYDVQHYAMDAEWKTIWEDALVFPAISNALEHLELDTYFFYEFELPTTWQNITTCRLKNLKDLYILPLHGFTKHLEQLVVSQCNELRELDIAEDFRPMKAEISQCNALIRVRLFGRRKSINECQGTVKACPKLKEVRDAGIGDRSYDFMVSECPRLKRQNWITADGTWLRRDPESLAE